MCFYCVLSLAWGLFCFFFESIMFQRLCINMRTGSFETFVLWRGEQKQTPQRYLR